MTTAAVTTTTFAVEGMTCGCCVGKVRDKVGSIPGVTAVTVDLDGGTVTVQGADPVERGAVADAVERAGFRLAD
ncbi:heavy-metal-associated domain-containing protein [Nocardia lijiangensis]|uniref:heavy-metal-associated domain-containing protein n=1 Tax=Nocardia lijiangensis TaxID=299618 RepID=UPI00082EC1F2|nr:heavy metal-associated domain-containing protein [Nocardia lijiangensis]